MDAETLTAEEREILRVEQMRVGTFMTVAIRILGSAINVGDADLATKTLYKIAELAEQLHAAENPGEGAGEAGVTALH